MARAQAAEDRFLGSSSITGNRKRIYKDIDIRLAIRESGDVFKKTDAEAVKQAVKNLVMTNYYEKPFLPKFGGNVRAMLFELADDETADDVEQQIISVISRFEPRAEVLNVTAEVRDDQNALAVAVTFRVISTNEIVTVNQFIQRLR